MTWHVYMIETVDGYLYTGIALDVERRYREHSAQGARAARFLLAHAPKELAFTAPVGTRSIALKVERRLKKLSRAHKEAIRRRGSFRFDPDSGRILEPERPR